MNIKEFYFIRIDTNCTMFTVPPSLLLLGKDSPNNYWARSHILLAFFWLLKQKQSSSSPVLMQLQLQI